MTDDTQATSFDDLAIASPEQRLLVETARRMVEFAAEIIARGDEFEALLDATLANGQRAMAGVADLFREEVKPKAHAILRGLLLEVDASVYVLATEGWTLPLDVCRILPLDEDGEPDLVQPIHEDDRRISVLSLTGESTKGDAFAAVFRIREGAERRLMLDEPLILEMHGPEDADALSGSLATLLREERG